MTGSRCKGKDTPKLLQSRLYEVFLQVGATLWTSQTSDMTGLHEAITTQCALNDGEINTEQGEGRETQLL